VAVAPAYRQCGAGGETRQGAFDQDVGAPVEPEVFKVDSRAQP
jgi:hypothetical protein